MHAHESVKGEVFFEFIKRSFSTFPTGIKKTRARARRITSVSHGVFGFFGYPKREVSGFSQSLNARARVGFSEFTEPLKKSKDFVDARVGNTSVNQERGDCSEIVSKNRIK